MTTPRAGNGWNAACAGICGRFGERSDGRQASGPKPPKGRKMSIDTTEGKRGKQYAALNAEHRARRAALDINYDQALDQHGADPVLLVAYLDGFDALDAEFLAKRDALDAMGEGAGV